MKYKDGIILKRTPYIIGCGFNIGEYEIQCPECGKIGKYGYDYASDRIPKYCTFCRADFEDTDTEEKELGCPLEVREQALNGFYIDGYGYVSNDDDFIYLRKDNNGYYLKVVIHPSKPVPPDFIGYCDIHYLKDYKKTWWLKEDKSE